MITSMMATGFNDEGADKHQVNFISRVGLQLQMLGKPLSTCHHLYLGIAQIAITPPPALKRALWGTFFQARFYHFLPF